MKFYEVKKKLLQGVVRKLYVSYRKCTYSIYYILGMRYFSVALINTVTKAPYRRKTLLPSLQGHLAAGIHSGRRSKLTAHILSHKHKTEKAN